MSSLPIPKSVRKYLGFGIKFIPKKPPDPKLIIPSYEDFKRRIHIKEVFKDKEDNNPFFNPRFHVKSSWVPPPSDDQNVEKGLRLIKANIMPLNYSNHTLPYAKHINNVVPKTFNDFIHHPDILIKPSDKNLGLTVIDKRWYIIEGLKQLQNPAYYKILNKNLFTGENLVKFIQELKANALGVLQLIRSPYCLNIYNKQVEKFLMDSISKNDKLPTFHLLPKIHKTPVQGRPIVPSHSWVTTGFSVYIDSFLQEWMVYSYNIIKDTKALIKSLDDIILPPKQTWFITGDVSSMYTNIPTDTNAFTMIAQTLSYYQIINEFEQTAILETLRFIMNNNYFLFNGIPVKQTSGIAMGTACAPAYANIFMDYTENVFFNKYKRPLFYGRYIDDILMIFQGTEDELKSLLHAFDTDRLYCNELKINWTYSQKSIDFLDLVISSSRDKIQFSTHQKALNKYLYIPFCSYHPKDSKTGFIKAELIRYVRNSSTYLAFSDIARKFFLRLRLRGYPPRYLVWVFSKVHYRNRSKYLEDSHVEYDDKRVPFVTTYNPIWEAPHLKNGLKLFSTLNPNYKPIIAFKKNNNLGDIINKANVSKLKGKRFRARPAETRWLSYKKPQPNPTPQPQPPNPN